MSSALYAGFDVGGSKTVCLVGDAERVLGRGSAGGGNPGSVGIDGFARAVGGSARDALRDAGLAPSPESGARLARAWLGVAGVSAPAVLERARQRARAELMLEDVRVTHDGALILPAAGLEMGVGLVAGTGSLAYGAGPGGRTAQVGGWGYLFGDEGSGYELGRRALRAVSQAADGRAPATALSAAILGALGIEEPWQLAERLYPVPPAAEVAALARHVLEVAETGDPVAQGLVDDAASSLAEMVRACARASGLLGPRSSLAEPQGIEVVTVGGLVGAGLPLLAGLAALLADGPYRLQALRAEPVEGALELARRPPSPPSAQDLPS